MTAYTMLRMARLLVEEAGRSLECGWDVWAARCLVAAERSLDRFLDMQGE